MADVWVQGVMRQRACYMEIYTAYKLRDNQCDLEAVGHSRVPDFWKPYGDGPFLDIPRTLLAAEFYAVIRGIVYAQQAGCDKIIVHTPSELVVTLMQLPVKINNETLRTMRDYIIELSTQIDVELVETSVWCVETILSDY
jgi:hypothetical protein